MLLAIGEGVVEEGCVGECHGLGHELPTLIHVEVGDSGESVHDQRGQLSILVDFAALSHLYGGVGAPALVAQDEPCHGVEAVSNGAGASLITAAYPGDDLLAHLINLQHGLSKEEFALDGHVTLL